jgi:hypothetical protein
VFLKKLVFSQNHIIEAIDSAGINWLLLIPTPYFFSSLSSVAMCLIVLYPKQTCVMETVLPNTSLVLDTNHTTRTCIVTEQIVLATYFVLSLLFEVHLCWVLSQSQLENFVTYFENLISQIFPSASSLFLTYCLQ